MVQETEYDDVITCKHSYSEKCHITYATDFTPQQEEECEENFKKNCFIEYKNVASDDKVTFCYTPLVRNCDTPGPTECSTEYTSECVTRYCVTILHLQNKVFLWNIKAVKYNINCALQLYLNKF